MKYQNINVKECKFFKDRLMGLMFKKNINYGLRFPHCNSIHTFFMKEAIDVVMTDKNNNILYVYYNFKPWHIITPKKNVYYTYEFPINNFKFNIGDKLKLESK
jgi:uncharacterized membrane protein (UPF0127 family)